MSKHWLSMLWQGVKASKVVLERIKFTKCFTCMFVSTTIFVGILLLIFTPGSYIWLLIIGIKYALTLLKYMSILLHY